MVIKKGNILSLRKTREKDIKFKSQCEKIHIDNDVLFLDSYRYL